MRSLQWRLTWSISVVLITILFGAGVLLYRAQRSALLSEFDAALNLSSVTLARLIETDGTTVKSEMSEENFPQFSRQESPDCYQILDSRGDFIERSRASLDLSLSVQIQVANEEPWFGPVRFSDGRRGRGVARSFVPRFEDNAHDDEEYSFPESQTAAEPTVIAPVTLVVARDTLDFERRLSLVARWIVAITLLAWVTAVAASRLVAQIGLAPLNETAVRIAGINIDNLATLSNTGEVPTEIQSIVDALNQMQNRLAAGYERERNFSADVAHELRTPIAGIRSITEVALRKPRNTSEYQESLNTCLTIAVELQSIVDNLLTLSQIESGTYLPHCEPTEVADLLQKYIERYSSRAMARGLKFRAELPAQILMRTDPDKLGIIFRNLIENAVSYASPDSTISIVCREEAAVVEFAFRNEVVDKKPFDLEKMFQRFWRADRARNEAGIHSGIGLTLCRSLTEILGGQISANAPSAGVIELVLRLPRDLETARSS